jgi:helix-turn-helix protein
MRQHLDIADVEAKTKIRAKYLRALENEEFGMLPGPTFVKTFIRTYAELLGLDPHRLVDEYRANYESAGELEQLQPLGPPGSRARERRRPPAGRGPRPGWVLLGVVAAVIAVLIVLGLTGGDDEGGDGSRAAQTETTTTPTSPRKERHELPAPPTRVVLRIAPVDATYVCIDTGIGTPVRFEGTLEAPQTFRGRRLRLNLGNTSVEMTVNGKAVPLEPSPEPVGFDFTPHSTRPLPLGERPCA